VSIDRFSETMRSSPIDIKKLYQAGARFRIQTNKRRGIVNEGCSRCRGVLAKLM
jgi:hypothetical protein